MAETYCSYHSACTGYYLGDFFYQRTVALGITHRLPLGDSPNAPFNNVDSLLDLSEKPFAFGFARLGYSIQQPSYARNGLFGTERIDGLNAGVLV
jgi:hypothetical protein